MKVSFFVNLNINEWQCPARVCTNTCRWKICKHAISHLRLRSNTTWTFSKVKAKEKNIYFTKIFAWPEKSVVRKFGAVVRYRISKFIIISYADNKTVFYVGVVKIWSMPLHWCVQKKGGGSGRRTSLLKWPMLWCVIIYMLYDGLMDKFILKVWVSFVYGFLKSTTE